MKQEFNLLLIFICTFALGSCIEGPELSDIPEVKFVRFSVDTLSQGFGTSPDSESTIVFIEVSDGDGNIGNTEVPNVFFIDLRQDTVGATYRIPEIPEIGSANGIKAKLEFTLPTQCCIYDDGRLPCEPVNQPFYDPLVYEIYIVDQDGNESNRALSDTLFLKCN